MRISLNGKAYECPSAITVGELLHRLDVPDVRVAVELNLDILPKSEYGKTLLHEGDCVEVVHFVGGGSGLRKDEGGRHE